MATKKTASKKTAPKKVAAKKTPAKKVAPAKKAPAKKAAPAKAAAKVAAPVAQASSLEMTLKSLPQLPFTLPVRTFVKWASVIVVLFITIGMWLAFTIVDARQQDLVAEIKERTAIQAQGRAAVVSEWISGQVNVVNHFTESDLVRLFSAEMTNSASVENADIRAALVAQIPYMQQTIKELVARNNLRMIAVVSNKGDAFLSSVKNVSFTAEQAKAINTVFATGQPVIQGASSYDDVLVLELHKPIFELQDEDKNPRVNAVVVLQIPMAEKLGELLEVGPLARDGERTYLLQQLNQPSQLMALVAAPRPTTLDMTEKDLIQQTVGQPASEAVTPAATLRSPVDGMQVFGSILPVPNTPFRIFHVFEAKKALAFMDLYRHGVYGMVALATLALIAIALFVSGHLIAQRNRTRVRHQGKAMEALVRAIEIRDPYISGHYERTARLSVNVGNDLGLPVPQRSTLYYAAQLAGLGKMFISQKTLTKKGKLTAAERTEIESHVGHAMAVLKDMEFDLPIADVIEQMYERMDGTGYPQALQGGEINILSRVLAVTDAYCALTRPRAYRNAMSEADAVAELQKHAAKYDNKVVVALAKRIVG